MIAGGLVVALSLAAGWNVDAETDQRRMAGLRAAAEAGDLAAVMAGATGLEPELLDPLARRATCAGKLAIVTELVKAGARPDVFGEAGLLCLLAATPGATPLATPEAQAEATALVRLLSGSAARGGSALVASAAPRCLAPVVVALLDAGVAADAAALAAALHCPNDLPEQLLARRAKGLDARERQRLVSALVRATRDGRLPPAAFERRLKALVAAGADVDGVDPDEPGAPHRRPSPLLLALQVGDPPSLAVIRALLAAGAKPRPPGVTIAAARGGAAIVQALLDAGGDAREPGALAAAARAGHVCGDLRAGAYRHLGGVHAPAQIEEARRGYEARCAEHHRLLALLLAGGADPRSPTWRGSPTLDAAYVGDAGAVTLLAAKGAALDARDQEGSTPLHAVATAGKLEFGRVRVAVETLLAAGANPSAQDAQGRSARQVLVAAGYADKVGDLLPPGGRSLAAAGARATASSVLVEKGRSADRYVPWKAIDASLKTCWCKGTKGHGVGEWLQLDLPAPARIRALRVYPGCGADDKVYFSNNRITRLEVRAGATAKVVHLAEGERRLHDLGVDLPDAVSSLRLTVLDVQEEADAEGFGKARHDDTCIGEVQADLESP